GQGVDFKGTVDLIGGQILSPSGEVIHRFTDPDTLLSEEKLTADPVIKAALEAFELARIGYPEFDLEIYRAGHLTPVIFGSALKTVSVPALLRSLGMWAPEPRPQPAEPAPIDPADG